MITTPPQTWERALFQMAEEARHTTLPFTPVPFNDAALLERAYALCESVISEHGKTFNLAGRLLPPAKRRAIRALYAFCELQPGLRNS